MCNEGITVTLGKQHGEERNIVGKGAWLEKEHGWKRSMVEKGV